jgi:hypothetical protein
MPPIRACKPALSEAGGRIATKSLCTADCFQMLLDRDDRPVFLESDPDCHDIPFIRQNCRPKEMYLNG